MGDIVVNINFKVHVIVLISRLWGECVCPPQLTVAPPPDEERTTSPRKVKGRREGVGGVIEEGVVDDTTERQSEVARANVVEAGV